MHTAGVGGPLTRFALGDPEPRGVDSHKMALTGVTQKHFAPRACPFIDIASHDGGEPTMTRSLKRSLLIASMLLITWATTSEACHRRRAQAQTTYYSGYATTGYSYGATSGYYGGAGGYGMADGGYYNGAYSGA